MRLRSQAGIAGLLMVFTLPITTEAQAAAAPVIRCLQSYGHEVPPVCQPNPDKLTALDYEGKVYPNSRLYPTGETFVGATGNIFVEGNATPGSMVSLTVTDGDATIGPFFLQATTNGSPSGPAAGDFVGEINVVALGSHRATPEADADNVGDDELGPTTLTITATATDVNGTGPAVTDTIVKHAASMGDKSSPGFSNLQWPPRDLDHGCNSRYTAKQWNDTNDGLGIPGIRFTGYSQCPWYPIAGTVRDFDGVTASEISDVRITISKGGKDYIDVRHSTDSALLPPGRGEILTRISADHSRYWYLLNIKDLPPNSGALVGLDSYYTITVAACDAWGDVSDPLGPNNANNCSSTELTSIVIYPF